MPLIFDSERFYVKCISLHALSAKTPLFLKFMALIKGFCNRSVYESAISARRIHPVKANACISL